MPYLIRWLEIVIEMIKARFHFCTVYECCYFDHMQHLKGKKTLPLRIHLYFYAEPDIGMVWIFLANVFIFAYQFLYSISFVLLCFDEFRLLLLDMLGRPVHLINSFPRMIYENKAIQWDMFIKRRDMEKIYELI